MLRKNVAGQYLYFALVNATTGAALTGATVTAVRTIDGGSQAACTGTVSEPGNGQYQIALSQADTNGNNIGYLFTATNAIPVSVMATLTAADPTDAASFGITRINATIDSRMATYTQPAGFLAATFPTGTIANTTNITAGTITTVSGNVTGNVGGNVTGSVGSVTGLNAALLDVAVSTRSTYAGGDTAGTTTLLSRLDATRAALLDNLVDLDVAVSSRQASGAVTLTTAAYEAAADALLARTISGGGNGGRDVTSALRFIRNRWVVSTGTLTVYQEDDTTSAWTAVVTGTPGADPITGTDPT